MCIRTVPLVCAAVLSSWFLPVASAGRLAEMQRTAVENNASPMAHWGPNPDKYVSWTTHSNRLIPVYTFGTQGAGEGIDVTSYTGPNSVYRDESRLREIYGIVPTETVATNANYMDQTDIYRIQKEALDAGKKHIILVVFDGMDWHTTRAAAIWKSGRVAYDQGRGKGLFFQDYEAAGTSQFGCMVTSPHNEGTNVDVNNQRVANPGGEVRGGYSIERAGGTAWAEANDPKYWIGKSTDPGFRHAYTDSSASATSMTSGIKTFNGSVNIDPTGIPVSTIAHQAQQLGYAIGVVTSVPISHATPASAYAHNVSRGDYQDLTRDLLGRPSIMHEDPLPGVDVLIGAGWGVKKERDGGQGDNFVPGNRYLAPDDLVAIDVEEGGQYVVATREDGVDGSERLKEATAKAIETGSRLFGFYGAEKGHLPYQGASGDYHPGPGWKSGEFDYSEADVTENVTLDEMAASALAVLETDPEGFWLMIEAGDVDWASHDNNIDAAVGATLSGDAAIKQTAGWVERHGGWDESVMIVTADHGHYLVIDDPSLLVPREE